jgi:hypothetical protein
MGYKFYSLGEKSEKEFKNGIKQYAVMKEWYNELFNMMDREGAQKGHWAMFKNEMLRVQKWLNDNKDLR